MKCALVLIILGFSSLGLAKRVSKFDISKRGLVKSSCREGGKTRFSKIKLIRSGVTSQKGKLEKVKVQIKVCTSLAGYVKDSLNLYVPVELFSKSSSIRKKMSRFKLSIPESLMVKDFGKDSPDRIMISKKGADIYRLTYQQGSEVIIGPVTLYYNSSKASKAKGYRPSKDSPLYRLDYYVSGHRVTLRSFVKANWTL